MGKATDSEKEEEEKESNVRRSIRIRNFEEKWIITILLIYRSNAHVLVRCFHLICLPLDLVSKFDISMWIEIVEKKKLVVRINEIKCMCAFTSNNRIKYSVCKMCEYNKWFEPLWQKTYFSWVKKNRFLSHWCCIWWARRFSQAKAFIG